MADTFDHLFSPFDIAAVTIPNRIVSTGHDTTIPTDGTVNDALIAYHTARAKGGVGLIVVQVIGVHETARYTNHVLMGTDDSCIAGFKKLADAVHQHGAKIFVQLFHPGREMTESFDGSAPVAYAPSVSPSERFHVIPRAMSNEMIKEVISGFGEAATRIEKAGVDGVEIVASHGYLAAQFLSPNVNHREDEYGGSPENRLRFLQESIDSAQEATSDDFVVGLRISANEEYDEGMDADFSLDVIKALSPSIDYVSVVDGTSATLGGAVHIVPSMYFENAYVAPFTKRVKDCVSIPVVVTGRINQPQEAERVIQSGQADFCGMTRALICDPEMPRKAQASRTDDIRACIACNQACIGHFHKGHAISCIQHPETGRELEFVKLKSAIKPKTIMVIGGGPAGMKAAAIAAERGHQVTLYEADSRLGGQARLAQLLPHRSEFGGIITNLERELALAGVTVKTKTSITAELIAQIKPDSIIIATGSRPRWPSAFEHDGKGQVVHASDVLKDNVKVGGSVVIADWTCDWVGSGVAEYLAKRGSKVRIAVNGVALGEALQSYVRDSNAARLHALGVEIIPYARLYGQDEDTVYLQHTVSGTAIVLENVDTLVLAQGNIPNTTLQEQLNDYEGEVISVGDCVMARTCEEAVLEGLRAGWAV